MAPKIAQHLAEVQTKIMKKYGKHTESEKKKLQPLEKEVKVKPPAQKGKVRAKQKIQEKVKAKGKERTLMPGQPSMGNSLEPQQSHRQLGFRGRR